MCGCESGRASVCESRSLGRQLECFRQEKRCSAGQAPLSTSGEACHFEGATGSSMGGGCGE